MKPGRKSPCRSRSAIHSKSRPCVLRPGRFLMGEGSTTGLKDPSGTLRAGFQQLPVAFMATWGTF